MSTPHETPLARAKRLAGGASGLAEKLNALDPDNALTSQAVSQWKQVPAKRCVEVALATGVPAHELRPDVFPEPKRRTPSKEGAAA